MTYLTTRTLRQHLTEQAEQGYDTAMIAVMREGAWQLYVVVEYNGERLDSETQLLHTSQRQPKRMRRDGAVRCFAERYGFTGLRLRFEEVAP